MRLISTKFQQSSALIYVMLVVLFSTIFFLCGILGLHLQSSQTGVTPVWPASGWAFAFLLLYGFRYWPGIVIGMLLISYYADMSILIGLSIGICASLEVIIPLIIARKYGFTGRLDSLFEASVFTLIVVFAPLISALPGSVVMFMGGSGNTLPPLSVVMLWWLGNSIGLLLVGGILLSTYEAIIKGLIFKLFWWKISFILIAFFISWFAFGRTSGIESALILNLMIPFVLVSAIRFGVSGAVAPSLIAVLVLLSIPHNHPTELFEHAPFGYLFLILVELWFVSLSGVLMAGAFLDRSSQAKMKWLALHDQLTKLANRTVLKQETEYALRGMRRMDKGVCLLFIDLDHLKPVNDQLGHLAGDELLVAVGKLLKKQVRNSDVIARWGGDEFIILLRDCALKKAEFIANSILVSSRELSFESNDKEFAVSMSIGLASARANNTHEELIKIADDACYRAKEAGRDQVVIANE